MSLNVNDVVVNQLEAELNAYKRDYEKEARQSSKRRNILGYLAEKLCDSTYGEKQLGGKNSIMSLSDEDLRDFITENVLSQKVRFTKNLIDLQKLYLNELKEKEKLAQRILDLKEEIEYLKSNQSVTTSSCLDAGIQKPDKNEEQKKEIHFGDNGEIYDIDKEYSKLSLFHFAIIQAIGEFGYSETNDIIRKTTEIASIKDTLVRQNLDELVKTGIVLQTKNPTPVRKNLYLYELSRLGGSIYKKHFDKKPVKSEMQIIAEQHDNIVHGYGIKDLAEIILASNGRTGICYDSSKNQFTLPGMPGQRYVPDVTSTMDGKTREYWEYELGHHKQDDFNMKLVKASVLTKELYIITPDKATKDKISNQLEEFMNYLMISEKRIKLKVYYGTMKELQDGVIFNSSACVMDMC